jgi:YD repeat-containing protein
MQYIYYTYDIHGRLTNQTCGTSAISYVYDNNGNRLSITDSTGVTTRTYDELNRVLTKSVPNVGITAFEYDIIDGVETGCWAEKSTDPKGNVTTKTYDRAGRLKKVTADGKSTTYTYYDNGATQSVVYHDGSREDYTYCPNGRLWTLTNKKADGTIIDSYVYEYDAAGNQTQKTDSKGVTIYTYDALNRLETVTEPDGTVTSYTFDRSGNRATETIVKGIDRTVNTYTYNEQNRLTAVTTTLNGTLTATVVYTYDNNGNQLTTTVNGTITTTNAYDELNQLIAVPSGDSLADVYTMRSWDIGARTIYWASLSIPSSSIVLTGCPQ